MDFVHLFRRLRANRLSRCEVAGALAISFLAVAPSVWAQTSPCDLTLDGVVNASDVSLAINMAIGVAPCTAQVEGKNLCTVVTVQRVWNAYNGQPCVVYNAHAAILSWTASTTPNATYNVYRATSAAGPFTTPVNSSPITGTTYTDTSVVAGQSYYYVATAVAGGTESADSSPPVLATIPSP